MVESHRGVPVLATHRLDALRELGDGLIAEVMGMFLDSAPAHLAAVHDAASAATGQPDVARLAREAHTLRGSSANLGFEAFAAACAAVEEAALGGRIDASGIGVVQDAWLELLPVAQALAGRAA